MAPRLAAALALLALVGLASTARIDGGEALSTSELAFAALLLVVAASVAIGVGTLAFGGGYALFADNRRKVLAALLLAALLAFVVWLLLAPIDTTDDALLPGPPEEPAAEDLAVGSGGSPFPAIAAVVIAAVAVLAAVLLALGAVGLFKRRHVSAASGEEESDAVLQALDESLDDLRREPDVRRAIVACYARMERALERAGSARRPAEAPFEYLVRILERVTANGRAARALTDLFERAKFSVEPMGERDKEQAIDALELLRAEVRPL